MQTTEDKTSRQPADDIDQELTDTLIAISVVARRLARKLEQEASIRKSEGENDNEQNE